MPYCEFWDKHQDTQHENKQRTPTPFFHECSSACWKYPNEWIWTYRESAKSYCPIPEWTLRYTVIIIRHLCMHFSTLHEGTRYICFSCRMVSGHLHKPWGHMTIHKVDKTSRTITQREKPIQQSRLSPEVPRGTHTQPYWSHCNMPVISMCQQTIKPSTEPIL